MCVSDVASYVNLIASLYTPYMCLELHQSRHFDLSRGKSTRVSDMNKDSTLFSSESIKDSSVRNHFVFTILIYKHVHLSNSVTVGPYCHTVRCVPLKAEKLNDYGCDS